MSLRRSFCSAIRSPLIRAAVGRVEVLDDVIEGVELEHRVVARDAGVLDLDLVVRHAPDRDFGAGEIIRVPGKFGRLCN